MRTVLLLPECLGVKRTGRRRDAGKNRQGEKGRKDRLHDHLLSVSVLAVVTTAPPNGYVARLARSERWRHAPVTNVDHFGIEPDSSVSHALGQSHFPLSTPPTTLDVYGKGARAPAAWRASRGLDSRYALLRSRVFFWPDWQKPMTAGCGRGLFAAFLGAESGS